MTTKFCAECGATNVPLYENFCYNCYWKFHEIGHLKKNKIHIPYCLQCGALKLSSGWTDSNKNTEIGEKIAYANIRTINCSPETEIYVNNIDDITWDLPNPQFEIEYKLTDSSISEFPSHDQYITLTVKLEGGICPICIKRKTGSNEVTLQLRAQDRDLTPEEIKTATKIAFEITKKLRYETPSAYISDIIESYGGIDFYFGDSSVADEVINEFRHIWIGHYEKNYKLITEDKEKKRVYKATYLYRLPRVKHGDLTIYNDSLYLVDKITKSGVILISLKNKSKKNVKRWNDLIIPDPFPISVRLLVISDNNVGYSYLMMRLDTYETFEISKENLSRQLEVGLEQEFIFWEDKYYIPI